MSKFGHKKKTSAGTHRLPRQVSTRPRADVFSYHSNLSRSELPQARSEKAERLTTTSKDDSGIKNSAKIWRYVPSVFAIVVIILSVAYSTILNINSPSIVSFSDTTPSLLQSNEVYQQGISDIMSKTPFSRSKLTIQTDKLEQEMIKMFPELAQVSVNIPLVGKRLIVQISPAQPVFILRSHSGNFVLDSRGIVLMPITDLQNKEQFNLITINDLVVLDNQVGQQVLPGGTIQFIREVVYQFESRGQVIESVDLPAVANELHVHIKGASYYIKFNLQNDSLQQVGSYFAFSEKLSSEQGLQQPAEYVDLRINGRVYYK